MHQFGGRLDARNGKNETPAHICAKNNRRGKTSPTALRFLHDAAPKSFKMLDANHQKPEDIAQKEENQAQLFFANLRAEKNAEEAKRFSEQKDDLLKQEHNVSKKCQDSLWTWVGLVWILWC